MSDQSQQRQNTTRERIKVNEPGQYQVVMHNDDITTMEFVVMLLEQEFDKSHAEALALMLAIHHAGRAIVGTYTCDIAKSKAMKAMMLATQNGFPLRCTCQPA